MNLNLKELSIKSKIPVARLELILPILGGKFDLTKFSTDDLLKILNRVEEVKEDRNLDYEAASGFVVNELEQYQKQAEAKGGNSNSTRSTGSTQGSVDPRVGVDEILRNTLAQWESATDAIADVVSDEVVSQVMWKTGRGVAQKLLTLSQNNTPDILMQGVRQWKLAQTPTQEVLLISGSNPIV